MIVVLAAVAIAPGVLLDAVASSATVSRIGLLWSADANDQTNAVAIEAFRAALRDHGYVEGRNLVLEHRHAAGRLERFPALASELLQAKVDVIVASSPLSIRAARQATSTTPIVMINGDPAMFASMARPGGNVTGLTAFQAELAAKQVELLKEAVPKISKLALLRSERRASGRSTDRAAHSLRAVGQPPHRA